MVRTEAVGRASAATGDGGGARAAGSAPMIRGHWPGTVGASMDDVLQSQVCPGSSEYEENQKHHLAAVE